MKKQYIVWLIVGAFVALALIYVWYAHASIYWKLGAAHLDAPQDMHSYTIGAASSPVLTYVAIGDSLTAGVGVDSYVKSYPYGVALMLASSTHKQIKLVPYAVPGVRTSYVINNFLASVAQDKPDVITLLIGINDIHGNVSNALFKANYEKILKALTTDTHTQIYAINLPYIGTPQLVSPLMRLYFNWRTVHYNAIIEELAKHYGVTYIDLYGAHTRSELNDVYYAADHFHPNAAGYALWTDAIYAGFHK